MTTSAPSPLLCALALGAQEGSDWVGGWRPGVGDPTISAWLITLLYFLAAMLCSRVTRTLQSREGKTWSALSLLLVILGFNKQLDFQVPALNAGKHLARQLGLYQYKSLLQLGLVCTVLSLCLLAAWYLYRVMRNAPPSTWLACLGVGLTLTYIFLRASAFNQVLVSPSNQDRWGWTLEASALVFVVWGALLRRRPTSRKA